MSAEEATFSALGTPTVWSTLCSLINPSSGLGKLQPDALNYLFVAGVAPLCGRGSGLHGPGGAAWTGNPPGSGE